MEEYQHLEREYGNISHQLKLLLQEYENEQEKTKEYTVQILTLKSEVCFNSC